MAAVPKKRRRSWLISSDIYFLSHWIQSSCEKTVPMHPRCVSIHQRSDLNAARYSRDGNLFGKRQPQKVCSILNGFKKNCPMLLNLSFSVVIAEHPLAYLTRAMELFAATILTGTLLLRQTGGNDVAVFVCSLSVDSASVRQAASSPASTAPSMSFLTRC
jgi:hypothetical protein